MIPPKFVQYVVDQVDKGKLTPEEGAVKLSNFCYCGIFNQVRCADIIEDICKKKHEQLVGRLHKGETMAKYRIGILNGDDIGLEIVPVAVDVVKAAGKTVS
jgi:hypothetical protein